MSRSYVAPGPGPGPAPVLTLVLVLEEFEDQKCKQKLRTKSVKVYVNLLKAGKETLAWVKDKLEESERIWENRGESIKSHFEK